MLEPAKSEVDAVWSDGALHPVTPLPLSEGARVRVVVQPKTENEEPFEVRFQRFLKLIEERPLHLGGVRFRRDDLYERD